MAKLRMEIEPLLTLPSSISEARRVSMVRSFGLIGQPCSPMHNEITTLASDLAVAETALVSLVDSDRNWFSGRTNFEAVDQSRWASFCTHVVGHGQQPLWVEDSKQDYRFSGNPFVVGEPYIRFYAGFPIVVNGETVGALCVFDSKPKPYDELLAARLSRLAKIAAAGLSKRHESEVLRRSLSASADALIDCDDTGKITGWSAGADRLFGLSAVEAIGQNITILVPPDQRAGHFKDFSMWRESGHPRFDRRTELTACRKDGAEIQIELWMSLVHHNGHPHIHANIRDITERNAKAAALKNAMIQAEAASLSKSMFLANMSHELRTPLNGVVAVTDLLRKTEMSDYQNELTSIIQSSSNHLAELVGNILDLARIEAGQIETNLAPVALGEIVNSVARLSAVSAEEKGLSLILDMPASADVAVLADALRIKQVLHNLVSNAVKFTQNGSVSIIVSRHANTSRFEVADTGIGFDEAQKQTLFDRFQQADASITRDFGGTGLGLAISRELVEQMGGYLDCRSQPSKGSVFWFELPLEQVEVYACEPQATAEDPPSVGRVLVADDNPTNLRVAELLLQTIGAEVVCVADGNQAVEAFENGYFDAILMDMMMPVMDGLAATAAIRRIEELMQLPRTPIIMLTANTLPEHVRACLEAGGDLHLPKPISAASLFNALSGPMPTSDGQAVAA